MLKKILGFILMRMTSLFLIKDLFYSRMGSLGINDLQAIHNKFVNTKEKSTIAIDIGCGTIPQNKFNAKKIIGLDLQENKKQGVIKIRVGFEKLPFKDSSIDYITAYDLLEHIPRYADLPEQNNNPFIFLMNECYRVLKKNGVFLSMTPVYPFSHAFCDPTHNNIMTKDTLRLYFSNQKFKVASHYGIKTNFKVSYEKMFEPHLICILKKNKKYKDFISLLFIRIMTVYFRQPFYI